MRSVVDGGDVNRVKDKLHKYISSHETSALSHLHYIPPNASVEFKSAILVLGFHLVSYCDKSKINVIIHFALKLEFVLRICVC